MKKHTLRILIICAVIVAVLIVCAAVILFTMSGKQSKVDGIKVTDSGCDVFGVSAKIVSAILDDEDPLLEIEWTNRTPKEYHISTHHTVYIESNGTFEKTEITEPSYSGTWALHPFEAFDDEYSLKYAELSTGAKYRIEVKISDKAGKEEGKAWIEFEISGKISMEYFYATVIERVYAVDDNGNNKDYLIVEPFDWEPESSSSDRIVVDFDTVYRAAIDYYELIEKGTMVRILYDGRIEETYPAKLPKVYEMERVLHLDRAEASCVSLKLYTSEERNKDPDSHDPMETLSNNECWRNTVNAKDEIIEILKSVEYEKTDHIFGESEVLSVEFMNSTVWYAAEYKTKYVYAIHDGAFYKVKDPEKLIKALETYIIIDGHSIINHEFYSFDDATGLENGSKVYPTKKFRKERFFYNGSFRDPCLVIPQSSEPCSGEVIDGFTVSKNVADFLHVEVYSTSVFYDDITDTWLVEISDEAHYQKVKEEAEKEDGHVELFYDRYCKVITDGKGKILYYFDYFSEE